LLALLACVEACSRLAAPVGAPKPLLVPHASYWDGKILYDPLLFWRMRPDIFARGEQLTNSLRLRGPEVPPKPPDEFRILSLGESTTFARRLSYGETYSKLVEDGLRTVGGKRLRVINAGVPAYTLFQGVTFLRDRAFALEPDAVMTYFGHNDFLPVTRRAFAGGAAGSQGGLTDRELLERRQTLWFKFMYGLATRSNLVRLLWQPRKNVVEVDPSRSRVPAEDRRLLLAELMEICGERGLELIVVVPWYRDFERHAPLLREFSERHGVSIVDLPEILKDLPGDPASYFADHVHPNAAGHRAIADAITESLGG
jgi:lysophospholipase L1-like esterase